ncbi:MAG: Mrp/NBP35 family ATP-binding protein [Pseudomonadota bacterium]|nr:Mrp/NBP35 family ATP-binding protein [Pseudomonadota bacterium]
MNIESSLEHFIDPYTQIQWNRQCAHWKTSTQTLTVGYPTQAHLPQLKQALNTHLRPHLDSSSITINTHIKRHQTQALVKPITEINNIIGVASNKGGVGKSTLAAHIAIALMQAGAKTGILDWDVHGPNIPQLLGTQQTQATIKHDGYQPVSVYGLATMSMGYLVDESSSLMWRGPMASRYAEQMLIHTQWPKLDYLIVDLPPGTGDIHLTLCEKIPISGIICVSTPQTLSIDDLNRSLTLYSKMNSPVLGIVKNMAYLNCAICQQPNQIVKGHQLEQLAKTKQIPIIGSLPINQELSSIAGQGKNILIEKPNHPLSQILKQMSVTATALLAKRPHHKRGNFPPIVPV